jgi:hypothetical protein
VSSPSIADGRFAGEWRVPRSNRARQVTASVAGYLTVYESDDDTTGLAGEVASQVTLDRGCELIARGSGARSDLAWRFRGPSREVREGPGIGIAHCASVFCGANWPVLSDLNASELCRIGRELRVDQVGDVV